MVELGAVLGFWIFFILAIIVGGYGIVLILMQMFNG